MRRCPAVLSRCPAVLRSPCFKLKPISKCVKSGMGMVNCETYGGLLWHTWFDRDLTVAGRVLVKEGDAMVHRLVRPQALHE